MGISSVLGTGALVPAGYGFRNLIINGAMQVAQRGTSASSKTTTGYYTADRFTMGASAMGTWTQSVENDAPTGSGFRKSLKMLCTTADASPASGDYIVVQHRLEGQNLQAIKKGTSSAEQLTLTFWVKANVTGTFVVALYDNDNTRACSQQYTISASATWEKKTLVFPADTTGAFDNDNALSLYVEFGLGAGSSWTSGSLQSTWGAYTQSGYYTGQTNVAAATNNYWQITGVQLEVGPVATAYEFKPIDVEIAQCQRYYEKSYADGTATATNTATGIHRQSSFGNASGNHYITVRYTTEKRSSGTVSMWTQAGGAGGWAVISSPQTGGYAGAATIINSTTKTFTVEQSDGGYAWQGGITLGHWECSAEL